MGEIFEQEFNNAIKEIEKEKIKKVKLKKVKLFLVKLFEDLLRLYNIKPEFPMIFSGIDGDVDLEWKNDNFQLLLSIPEGDELAGLYGNNYGDDEIKIDFDVKTPNLELYEWIKRQFK